MQSYRKNINVTIFQLPPQNLYFNSLAFTFAKVKSKNLGEKIYNGNYYAIFLRDIFSILLLRFWWYSPSFFYHCRWLDGCSIEANCPLMKPEPTGEYVLRGDLYKVF